MDDRRVGNLTVVDGDLSIDDPAVILDAATARMLIADGELESAVDYALRSLDLTGKSIIYVKVPTDG